MFDNSLFRGIFSLIQSFWNTLREWMIPYMNISLFDWLYIGLAVSFILVFLGYFIGHRYGSDSGSGVSSGSGSGGDKKISSERKNDEK